MKEITEINNSPKKRPRVLVAPLDWGLGHATRCIPLINELLTAGCEVVIASEKGQKKLLELEFPLLEFKELDGYRLKYGKKGWQTPFIIFFYLPKILIRIKRENRWLRHLLEKESFDAVISDNRYGLHAPGLFSVFVTHQLCIQTPFGKTVEKILQKINYRFINKFNACWVPDFENVNALAGRLSHPKKFPRTTVQYIGILSRFEKKTVSPVSIDLLILLSGPEPQRSIFEKILLMELTHFNGKVVFVRGLPAEKNIIHVPDNVEVYNHLPSVELNKMICDAACIISRPGYSTVMDLVKLDKKSILVPTPGQTEQEYLAAYLLQKKIAFSVSQHHFSLQQSLEAAGRFPFTALGYNDSTLLPSAIAGLLKIIA